MPPDFPASNGRSTNRGASNRTPRELESPHGTIRYWVDRAASGSAAPDRAAPDAPWLVFLHGLLVDHRLFTSQLEHFSGRCNLLAWDSPAHNESRPYDHGRITRAGVLGVAEELLGILDAEGVRDPVLIGQSFGGLVAQSAVCLRPGLAEGFVGIDTFPMQRSYWRAWQLEAIRHMEPMLRMRSWEQILEKAPAETSRTVHAQNATRDMLSVYEREEYIQLAARTFRAISDTVKLDLPLRLPPTLLVCGEHDTAGMIRQFNKRWSATSGAELAWIPGAGHNANMDNPAAINAAIEQFLTSLP